MFQGEWLEYRNFIKVSPNRAGALMIDQAHVDHPQRKSGVAAHLDHLVSSQGEDSHSRLLLGKGNMLRKGNSVKELYYLMHLEFKP